MTIFLQDNNRPAAGIMCFKKVGPSHFAERESQIGGSVVRWKSSAKTSHLSKAQTR